MSAGHPRARTLISALVVCEALTVGFAPATSIAAPVASETVLASPTTDWVVPGVTIEVDRAMQEDQRIRGWVEDQARAVFERRGAPLGPDDEIRLSVSGELFDYGIRIELLQHDMLLDDQPDAIVCECGTDEMLERVAEAIDAGADRLAQVKPMERGVGEASPTDVTGPVPLPAPQRGTERRISGLGVAGAVLTGIGGGAVVGGIVMMALGPRALPNAIESERNWRPPGMATLIAGGAVLAAGVSMVVVDVARCRKTDAPRRCRHRDEGLAVGPALQAGGGGVSIVGRF